MTVEQWVRVGFRDEIIVKLGDDGAQEIDIEIGGLVRVCLSRPQVEKLITKLHDTLMEHVRTFESRGVELEDLD